MNFNEVWIFLHHHHHFFLSWNNIIRWEERSKQNTTKRVPFDIIIPSPFVTFVPVEFSEFFFFLVCWVLPSTAPNWKKYKRRETERDREKREIKRKRERKKKYNNIIKRKMELLMWVAVAFPLLIIINGALLAKLDNQRKIINLENILHGFDEKDYHGFKGK